MWKAYDRINREALLQVLRRHDMASKLLNSIPSMYVNSLVCVSVNGGESDCFRINAGRHGCIISPWLFSVYMDAVMKEAKIGMDRMGVRCQDDGIE